MILPQPATDSELPEDVVRRAIARVAHNIKRARVDPDAFIEWVGQVEGGGRARQCDAHREWQRVWSEQRESIILAPVGTGKSKQLGWRLIWEIGRSPGIRIAIISNSEKRPKKLIAWMKTEIESNTRIKQTFPHLRRATGARVCWQATAFLVERNDNEDDPTVQIFGRNGKIRGSRLHRAVLDDFCDLRGSLTKHSRDLDFQWLQEEVITRLIPKTGRVVAIGTFEHEDDVLQQLHKSSGVPLHTYVPAVQTETGERVAVFPDSLPLDELAEKERLLGSRAAKVLWQRAPDEGAGRFRRSWFEKCLKLGRGMEMARQWDGRAYTGVDLGHRKKAGSDLTALFTFAVHSDGMRQPLEVRSGRWTGPEILEEIQDTHRRYGSIIAVENNAAQQFLLDFASDLDTLPIRPHTTGINKHDYAHGVESLGLELQQGRWMIPCDEDGRPGEEVAEWIGECIDYHPDAHAGDRLMACWIAREAARKSPMGSGVALGEDDAQIAQQLFAR